MTWPTNRFPIHQEIRDRLIELQGRHPTLCRVADLSEATVEGRRSNMLRIGRAAVSPESTPRNKVLFCGGVHAREWAPPLSLVNLAETLLAKIAAVQANTPDTRIEIGTFKVEADDLRAIFEHVDLIIAPMINPDGYDFSLNPASPGNALSGTSEAHPRNWRKNRRPAPSSLPAGCTTDDPVDHPRPRTAAEKALMAHGVDINRNFNVAWDFQLFYHADQEGNFQSAAGTTILDGGQPIEVVGTSKRPCDVTFNGGPDAFSEPEARNVRALLESHEPAFYVDVHMFGPDIMFSWGIEENGRIDTDTPQPVRERRRDGTRAPTLRSGQVVTLPELVDPGPPAVTIPRFFESINGPFLDSCLAVGTIMSNATANATGNRYRAIPGAQTGSLSGASDDFAFARNLGSNRRPCKAYTLESGAADRGGFHPDFQNQFPDIQKEIQAALLALLKHATTGGGSCCS